MEAYRPQDFELRVVLRNVRSVCALNDKEKGDVRDAKGRGIAVIFLGGPGGRRGLKDG